MVKNAEKASYRHRARMTPRRPASGLAERWTMIDGVDVFRVTFDVDKLA